MTTSCLDHPKTAAVSEFFGAAMFRPYMGAYRWITVDCPLGRKEEESVGGEGIYNI